MRRMAYTASVHVRFALSLSLVVLLSGCSGPDDASLPVETPDPQIDTGSVTVSSASSSSISSAARMTQPKEAGTLLLKRARELHVRERHESAVSFYLAAAETGSRKALQEITSLFQHHEGYEPFEHNLMTWLHQAAQKGHMGAQLDMARRYLSGIGVQRDFAKAYAWYLVVTDSAESLPEDTKRQWTGTENVLSDEQLTAARRMADAWGESLPVSTEKLDAITYLHADADDMAFLIEHAEDLPRIHTLMIHGKNVNTLPQDLGRLNGLLQLIIHSTSIGELPSSIGDIASLQTLHVFRTPIDTVPASIGNLEHLRHLIIDGTNVVELPREVSFLTKLQTLHVRISKLKRLPSDLSDLTHVTEADFRLNDFTSVPTGILSLPNVTRILLAGNDISDVPREVLEKESLEYLDLSNNPIVTERLAGMRIPSTLTIQGLHETKSGGSSSSSRSAIARMPAIPLPMPPLQNDMISLHFYSEAELEGRVPSPSIIVARPISDHATAPQVALEMLFAGPSDDEAAMGAMLTDDLRALENELRSVEVIHGKAVLDFNRAAMPLLVTHDLPQIMTRTAIERTLLALPDINGIRYSFNGTPFTDW